MTLRRSGSILKGGCGVPSHEFPFRNDLTAKSILQLKRIVGCGINPSNKQTLIDRILYESITFVRKGHIPVEKSLIQSKKNLDEMDVKVAALTKEVTQDSQRVSALGSEMNRLTHSESSLASIPHIKF